MKTDKIVAKLLKEHKRHIAEAVREIHGEAAAKTVEELEDLEDWGVLKKYLK